VTGSPRTKGSDPLSPSGSRGQTPLSRGRHPWYKRGLRFWVPVCAALLVGVLAVVDGVTSDDVVIVPLYVLAPLIAALAGSPRATAAVGAFASVLAVLLLIKQSESIGQDLVRLSTVVLGAFVAVWIAVLRDRLTATAGLLDVIFERAPVGLALLDTELTYVRVNDRLAAINGLPGPDHVGHTIAELLPDLPPEVQEDVARVARTGEPLIDVPVSGVTPAQPGSEREFLASYWPVRSADDDVTGVGIVVNEVTERRVAERALRAQTDRYEALLLALSDAGEGMLVLERDGRCVYANSAFEQLSGYTSPELAAMETVLDLVVEYDDEDLRRRAAARLDEGLVTPALPLTLRRRDGGRVDLEVGGMRLDIEERRQMVVVVRDVTSRRQTEADRERLLARSALLAEASELFDQSLDERATMESVARLCVRELAETCVILLGDAPTNVHRVAAAEREPERGATLLARLESDAADPIAAAMDGEGHVSGDALIVPLIARGRVRGVLAAGFDRAPVEDDLVLFEDLGRRAALALDSARLYAERDHIARTLQQSLLPRDLPAIPGVELAARYRAAGAGNEVGGDFYDCFATGGGDWGLVIGDVCGKGAEAAALTALARYTLRAAAQHTRRPQVVLNELNDALLRDRLDYRFCTVLYVSLMPREDRVTACVSAAGHPLPLVLRADGQVETAGRPGSLLGIVDVPELFETNVDLAPGDALVLFTDGVTEADRSAGPEWLAEVLATHAGEPPAAIAEAVERDAMAAHGGPARDDVAVVVVRPAGPAASFAAPDVGIAALT
jgi:PAS domain S-box-containing protein